MNICFVAHLGDLSGANKSLIDLVSAIREHGVNVFVIVPRKGDLSRKLDELKIPYKSIYSGSWLGNLNKESKIKKIAKKIINVFAEYRFYNYFKKNKYDVVHYNSFIYGVGSRSLLRLGRPYVWHIREFPEETFGLTFYNRKNSYDLVSKSEKIFAISHSIYDHFLSDFEQQKMCLIYNGVNINHFLNPKKEIFTKKNISILIVGAIAEDKGQFEAIKAIGYLINEKNFRNITLNIVGNIVDTEYLRQMELYIEKENIKYHVIFHGFHSDISTFRRESDIALICSKMEAFGRVTIEAMLSKQLVIGANTGGTAELIKDMESGLLYEQGNYYSLASKIEYAFNLTNKPLIEKIIDNAYKYSKSHFSIQRTALEVINQYKEIRGLK